MARKSLGVVPLNTTVFEDQKDWLQQKADEKRRTVSLILRDLIEEARQREAHDAAAIPRDGSELVDEDATR